MNPHYYFEKTPINRLNTLNISVSEHEKNNFYLGCRKLVKKM